MFETTKAKIKRVRDEDEQRILEMHEKTNHRFLGEYLDDVTLFSFGLGVLLGLMIGGGFGSASSLLQLMTGTVAAFMVVYACALLLRADSRMKRTLGIPEWQKPFRSKHPLLGRIFL
jgi:hypothetical protein